MKWTEILKVGKVKDNSGKWHNFTEKDLDSFIEMYENRKNDAPVVVGHPKTNSPAYGWVDKLKREGEILKATFKDLVPEFVGAVKKKIYKYISISFNPITKKLRHVGFLGGAAPAVEGLAEANLSEFEEEYITVEFAEEEWSERRIRSIGRLFQRIREFFIEKWGIEETNNIISAYDADYLKEIPPKVESVSSFNEDKTKEVNMDELEKVKQELLDKEDELTNLTEEADNKETENKKLKKDLADIEQKGRKKEISEFVDSLKKEGRLLPKHEKTVSEILMNLKGQDFEIEFSEEEKKTGYDSFSAMLKDLPVVVPLGDLNKKEEKEIETAEFGENVDEDALEIHKEALALCEKEGIEYVDAVNKINQGGK
jgi:hypothetical protein